MSLEPIEEHVREGEQLPGAGFGLGELRPNPHHVRRE